MKKQITLTSVFAAVAALTLVAACNKVEPSHVNGPEIPSEGSSRITLSFPAEAATKAGTEATTAEKTINSLRVFVFDSNNLFEKELVGVTIAGDKLSATATGIITNGVKTFRALANTGSSFAMTAGTTTVSQFDTQMSLLSDNLSSGSLNLVMAASATKEILKDETVNMSLSRLVSKVCLTKIVRNFSDSELGKLALTVKAVYIEDVAGYIYWGGAAVPAASQYYYNKFGTPDAAMNPLLYADVTDFSVAQGGSSNQDIPFYVYSNPATEESVSLTWSPRKSRIVLVVEYAGQSASKYYTAYLPQTDPNKVYNVELTLQHGPAESPVVEPGTEADIELAMTANITVSDWGSVVTVPVNV